MSIPTWVKGDKIFTWSALLENLALLAPCASWMYRGETQAESFPTTTLERCCIEWYGQNVSNAPDVETGLLRHFQRQAHRYLRDLPPQKHGLEWLALMRHHGAPTRLLDWTYSFYVAELLSNPVDGI